MNQNLSINQSESSPSVRAGHLSEVAVDSDFLLEGYQMEIPYGYCHCGCGNLAPIATITDRRWHHVKGKPIKFINGHSLQHPSGENHPLWKGGKKCDGDGRNWVYMPNHKKAKKNYVLGYVLIAEKILAKPLPERVVIHHFDEITSNDKNENLVICENDTYHKLLHQRMRALKACGHPSWRKCHICKQYDQIENLYIPLNRGSIYHKRCKSRYQRTGRRIITFKQEI